MTPLDYTQERLLLAGALSAIWHGHIHTFDLNRTAGANPQPPEEDFVASLILAGLPQLVPAWAPLFQRWGWSLNIIGVFCHQKPYVKFQHNGAEIKRELADLLLLHRHTDATGRMEERAVLLQAKMITSAELTADDDGQLALYEHWGKFRVLGATGRASAPDYQVVAAPDQALYAGIARMKRFPEDILDLPDGCPWGTAKPAKKTAVERSLAALLVDLIALRAGRPCAPSPAGPNDDWPRLIQAIRHAVFHEPLRTRDYKQPGVERGTALQFNRTAFVHLQHNPEEKLQFLDGLGGGTESGPGVLDGGEGRAIIFETRARRG